MCEGRARVERHGQWGVNAGSGARRSMADQGTRNTKVGRGGVCKHQGLADLKGFGAYCTCATSCSCMVVLGDEC